MRTLVDHNFKIQFHLGNPELVQAPPSEICAFGERIQKVVVNAEDLMDDDEKEVSEEKLTGVPDVEQEKEIERIRKEEEIHPDEIKSQSCL